jgi:glutathione S-transferase
MKLYSGDLSPYSARVRMQIYAKGISGIVLERPPGFPASGFDKVNPLGRIPALDVDGDVIPESDVIAEYLEELYPEPSLLGATPRESALIRTVARIGDIYLMNNIFMCLPQARRSSRNEGVRDLLTGQVVRGLKALEHYIGEDGFAVGGRLTLADCALVPALFLVENVFETFDVRNPLPDCPKSSAYWASIQTDEHAARTLVELHRGLEERRALTRAAAAG